MLFTVTDRKACSQSTVLSASSCSSESCEQSRYAPFYLIDPHAPARSKVRRLVSLWDDRSGRSAAMQARIEELEEGEGPLTEGEYEEGLDDDYDDEDEEYDAEADLLDEDDLDGATLGALRMRFST